MNKLAYYSP